MPLTRLMPALALTGLVALAAPARAQAPAGAQAAAPFSDAQRQAVEGIIKDYLLKNPEILQEAMTELEKRQQETQKQAQASALKDSRDTLHGGLGGIVAGNPNGDVTLVEFFDYNCGYCKRALADLQTVMKADPKLKVVLKDSRSSARNRSRPARVALAVKRSSRATGCSSTIPASSNPAAGSTASGRWRWPARWGSTSPGCRRTCRPPTSRRRCRRMSGSATSSACPAPRLHHRRRDHPGRGRRRADPQDHRGRAPVRPRHLLRPTSPGAATSCAGGLSPRPAIG